MSKGSTAANMPGRGAVAGVAGVAGTVVMTAFQKVVEMPITGRSDSYAPADFAEKVFRLAPETPAARRRLNNATHLALGTMWGAAYALAARAGLGGPPRSAGNDRPVQANYRAMEDSTIVRSR